VGPAAQVVHHSVERVPGRVFLSAQAAPTVGGPALSSARIVVAVGRGIGDPAHLPLFRALADRLGAALGASRVVVDAGWLPFAHQVGQTGTSVSPDLYLAFGISGAVQHLAGMRGSSRVIAVNTDRDAPLCRLADLVVQGDAVHVATQLLERLSTSDRAVAAQLP
jgi:electron transfer flavoprotein alpha subunit